MATETLSLAHLTYQHNTADYISVTPEAEERILKLLQSKIAEISKNENIKNKLLGVKLTIPTKGCGGSAYEIEYAYENINVDKNDELLILSNNARLFIDPKKSFSIFGLIMDFEDNGVEYGFKFENPQEKAKCKCGTSFFINADEIDSTKSCD